ncbi:hypothetical protein [Nafulsella turpanensis]|uniref:hypothetical protein n=1 Tax=Nafulsella turpanensis TaxID=1265690 RepID=UPI000375DBF3|nr:hypothetical protein [Nafulsella turpanensis]
MMKYWLTYIVTSLFWTTIFAQDIEAGMDGDDDNLSIQVELIMESDTLSLEKPFYLYLDIRNRTKKSIYVPKEIDLISDLYPNGINGPFDGAVVSLKFDPKPVAPMYVENNVVLSDINDFVKIRPNSSVRLKLIDLRDYINYFNADMDAEELEIKEGSSYKLKAIYKNRYEKKGTKVKSFTGTAFSQEKTLYIDK